MAVEPREIEEPKKTETSTLAQLEQEAADEAAVRNRGSGESIESGKKEKKSPLIPILAGLVALIVVGLLAKVVLAK